MALKSTYIHFKANNLYILLPFEEKKTAVYIQRCLTLFVRSVLFFQTYFTAYYNL